MVALSSPAAGASSCGGRECTGQTDQGNNVDASTIQLPYAFFNSCAVAASIRPDPLNPLVL